MTRIFLDKAILVLLFIFIITEHHYLFTAVKNISLYLAFIFSLILLVLDKEKLRNVKDNFSSSKSVFICLILFFIYTLLISYFPYSDQFNSFKDAFGEFGRGFAFLIIILIWTNKDENKVKMIFYAFFAALFFITFDYFLSSLNNLENFANIDEKFSRIVRRKYSEFVDRFLIFALLLPILAKTKLMKNLSLLFCFLVLIMDLLSGARGSWLACICGIFILLAVLVNKDFLQKNYKKIIFTLAFFGVIFYFFLNNSGIIKYKIAQKTNTSGRYELVLERFPAFYDSGRLFIGIGHGIEQYNELLRNYADRGMNFSFMQINKNTGERHWFNDEPFFIGNLYYYGIFGIVSLFLAILILSYKAILSFKNTKNIFYLAIFISLFDYYGVRGLFECTNIRILYIFYMLGFFILLNANYKKISHEA